MGPVGATHCSSGRCRIRGNCSRELEEATCARARIVYQGHPLFIRTCANRNGDGDTQGKTEPKPDSKRVKSEALGDSGTKATALADHAAAFPGGETSSLIAACNANHLTETTYAKIGVFFTMTMGGPIQPTSPPAHRPIQPTIQPIQQWVAPYCDFFSLARSGLMEGQPYGHQSGGRRGQDQIDQPSFLGRSAVFFCRGGSPGFLVRVVDGT